MIKRLLYTSRATEGVGLRDAYDIIRVSHNRNSRAGITGGLIFIDGHFLQLLEGLPTAVDERYARIAADRRHTDVTTRLDEMADDAAFRGDWMALRDGSLIDADLLRDFSYQPGMTQADGPQLLAFLLASFDRELSIHAAA